MSRARFFTFLIFLFMALFNAPRVQAKTEEISFSIIKTGTASTREAMVFDGGSLGKKVVLNHSAIIIHHGADFILFDTGLGKNIEKQFKHDMPWWAQSLFPYELGTPAVEQLPLDIRRSLSKIFLSHVHWDHASALQDFPGSCVAIATEEKEELKVVKTTATFPSQFSSGSLKWCDFAWSIKPYEGFEKSYDIFRDQSAVLVPLPGHTYGSVGLFLTISARKYFFIGDLTWSLKALKAGKSKFWASSKLVDRSRDETLATLQKVKKMSEKNTDLIIVPAHDSEAQDAIGYFPRWIH